jgi:hypothetical protein
MANRRRAFGPPAESPAQPPTVGDRPRRPNGAMLRTRNRNALAPPVFRHVNSLGLKTVPGSSPFCGTRLRIRASGPRVELRLMWADDACAAFGWCYRLVRIAGGGVTGLPAAG